MFVIVILVVVVACILAFMVGCNIEARRPRKKVRIRGEKLNITYTYHTPSGDVATQRYNKTPELHNGSAYIPTLKQALKEKWYAVTRPIFIVGKDSLYIGNTTIPYHRILKVEKSFEPYEFEAEVQFPMFGECVLINQQAPDYETVLDCVKKKD